ncbi:hypothetical protein [Bosea sp. (in: a-proteobacteria)]|uniref:hypothetical protein n=1 Tax=Bosea sp. (in: a-proteobacteria) TaxID=1871050 RepID=UPI002FC94306
MAALIDRRSPLAHAKHAGSMRRARQIRHPVTRAPRAKPISSPTGSRREEEPSARSDQQPFPARQADLDEAG